MRDGQDQDRREVVAAPPGNGIIGSVRRGGRWASNLAAATALLLVDALSRRDGRQLAGARCCRARAHPNIWRQYDSYKKDYRTPVLDLLRHCQECLLDVGGVLRRRLEEGDGELVREFLVEG